MERSTRRNLWRFSSLVARETGRRGGRATCRVDSGETKAGRKGKKCLFRQRSDFPPPFRPLFPAFEFSAPTFPFFRPSPSPLSLLTPTWKLSESFLRGNVPIFPVFLEGEEDRRLAKLRGRMRNNGGEKDRRRCGGGWNTDGGSVKAPPSIYSLTRPATMNYSVEWPRPCRDCESSSSSSSSP